MAKNLPANAGDVGSVPGLGRSPGGGKSTPLQYSCLGNPMDRGARWATVHGVAKSQTQFSDSTSTEMFNNVVLVSGVQQSDSAIHILVSILLQNLFPLRLSQNIEHHSLCYAAGPCWLFIFSIAVCT